MRLYIESPIGLPEHDHASRTRYVDPWSVEHLPNPVVFAHMNDLSPSKLPSTEDGALHRLSTQSSASKDSERSMSDSLSISTPTTCTSQDSRLSFSRLDKLDEDRAEIEASQGMQSSSLSPVDRTTSAEASDNLHCNLCKLSFKTIGRRK